MIHEWTQPLVRMEYKYQTEEGKYSEWRPVLFIRPLDHGYEIMGINGNIWRNRDVLVQMVTV